MPLFFNGHSLHDSFLSNEKTQNIGYLVISRTSCFRNSMQHHQGNILCLCGSHNTRRTNKDIIHRHIDLVWITSLVYTPQETELCPMKVVIRGSTLKCLNIVFLSLSSSQECPQPCILDSSCFTISRPLWQDVKIDETIPLCRTLNSTAIFTSQVVFFLQIGKINLYSSK